MLTIATADDLASGPNAWFFVIAALQFIANTFFAIAMWWVAQKAKKVDTLEAEIKQTAKALIDTQIDGIKTMVKAQLEAVTGQFASAVASFNTAITAINDRLRTGEAEFRDLGKRDHAIELKLSAAANDIKEYIRENCANKNDVKVLADEVTAIKVAMA